MLQKFARGIDLEKMSSKIENFGFYKNDFFEGYGAEHLVLFDRIIFRIAASTLNALCCFEQEWRISKEVQTL